jgi:cation:H+ antiporter
MVQGGPAIQVAIIVAAVAGLWLGARLLVDSAVRLASRIGLSGVTIGLTVVAAGTSMPELVVTTGAALDGFGDIAVGNVVGSSIYNLTVVLGAVAALQLLPIRRSLVRREGVTLVVATLVSVAVMVDGTVSRVDGLGLVGLFVAYTAYLLRRGVADGSAPASPESQASITRAATERVAFRGRDAVLLVSGLAVVLVSGDLMVGAATTLARGVGISEWVIGGTVVAAGTSTPEFAVSLVAVRRGRLGISVGNVVGSNVFNLVGVLGFAAAVRPLSLSGAASWSLWWLVAISVAVVGALWTGRQLSRPEGGLLVGSEVGRWVLGLLGVT